LSATTLRRRPRTVARPFPPPSRSPGDAKTIAARAGRRRIGLVATSMRNLLVPWKTARTAVGTIARGEEPTREVAPPCTYQNHLVRPTTPPPGGLPQLSSAHQNTRPGGQGSRAPRPRPPRTQRSAGYSSYTSGDSSQVPWGGTSTPAPYVGSRTPRGDNYLDRGCRLSRPAVVWPAGDDSRVSGRR